jgi:hypothetical protein
MSNSEDFRVTVYRIRKSLKMHNETVKDALNNLHKLKIISYINCSTIKVNINEFENHVQSSTANDTINSGTSTPSDSTPNDTTTSNPSELPQVPKVNHASTPIDTIIVPQVNNNNTNEQYQEKKNTQEELTKRSGFDVFGGGVPVPVTLAAPPLGSLAPPTPTHTPSIDDSDNDNITKVTNPVTANHIPIKVEERSDTKKIAPKELVKEVPTFHYTAIEIDKQIETYLQTPSKFFFGGNQTIVANTYLEFYNAYPMTKANIEGYEQVLYVYLREILSTMEKHIESTQDLNNALDNIQNLTIASSDIMNYMNIIKTDTRGSREKFKKIISAVNIQVYEYL